MAGTVMHLVIADRLLDILHIENPSIFYCGNLAPDAIMARENYVRDMKTHTHFKDGQTPFDFRLKENQEIYHKRLMAFYQDEICKQTDRKNKELYLGYLVHILVDELYLLNYYGEFVARHEKGEIDVTDYDYIERYIRDVDLVDWELARTYQFQYPMPEILMREMDYEIEGWITNEELIDSKYYIIYRNFETPHEKEELQVASYERNMEFIEYCVKQIPEILKERFHIS